MYRLEQLSIWNIHRDPKRFPDPDVFDPLRFYEVTSEGKLPRNASLFDGLWSFGYDCLAISFSGNRSANVSFAESAVGSALDVDWAETLFGL